MSSKNSSLAVEEIKEKNQDQEYEITFEPKLKVLINKRYVDNPCQNADTDVVSIGGRITISF